MTISIRKRSSPCIEELEPRILYSADLSPIAPDAPAPAPVQRVINADGEFSFSGSAAATASTPQMRAQTLVFVDARTPNPEELIEDIRSQQSTQRDIQIVVLDRDQDGIKAIGDVLQQKGAVGALHIIGHGSNGKLELGSTRLDFDTLLDNAVSIKRWSDALTQDADILIYGCDVAQTAAGQGLVDALARLTGADVGASTDPTGSAALGGDWDLEYLTGEIEEPLIISVDEQGLWDHLLDADAQPQVAASVVSVPLAFEQNVGQLDASVQFLAHGSGYAVALTNGDAILALQNADSTALVKLQVVGKNATPAAAGEQLLESKTNYLIGDQANWRTDIANYAAVSYQNVYDGIDLRYYGSQRQLEYDFIVAAHHDVNSIQLRFDGAQQLSLAENGDLLLTLDESGRTLAFHAPVAYQDGAGGREHVDSRYVINADGTVGFEVGAYDADRALVIDPVLLYGTYFGGTGFDTANGVGVDAAGNVYMTGYSTLSAGVLGGLLNGLLGTGGGNDVFVTKYSANMQSVIYSTYVGGSGDDRATAIAIDANGNAYVTGSTKSSNFPTASAYQGARDGGQDAFVLKLNAAGDAITYSTYLGGSGGSDVGNAIAVDAAGNAYVAGYASSSNFPVTAGAADSTYEGGEAFVSKLNATGNALLYSSFIGGSASDTGYGIAVDGAGNAVVVGETDSNNLLTSAGAYQATYGGGTDAFVVTLNSTGTAFGYSSYLGGSGRDAAYAVALGGTGKIYLTGETKSSNFDVTAGAYQTADPKEVDAFVSIIDPTSSGSASLVYSTYLGGDGNDEAGTGIGVDSSGRVYVAGYSEKKSGGSGKYDGFVMQINPAGGAGADLLYDGFLGGSNNDEIKAAVFANGKFYVAGFSESSSGIAKTGGNDTTYNGGKDAFAAVYQFNAGPTLSTTSATLVYNENAGKVAVDGGLILADADSALIAGAGVQITGNYTIGEDLLDFNNVNAWGITAVWTAATGTLSLTGNATAASYQAALRSVMYQNVSEKPQTATRTVSFTATDGALSSAPASRQISVASINDAPTISAPGAQTVAEDTVLVLSTANGNALRIGDLDAGSSVVQVTLNITNGTATLAQTTGLTFVTGTGSANSVMTFSGTLTRINAALDGMLFNPAANFAGAAGIQITTSDLGNTGSGGPLTAVNSIAVNVTAVNDAPVNSVPGPQATQQNTPLVFSTVNGNAISVADVDGAAGTFLVTLNATNGTLILGSVAGLVSVSGEGTANIALSGTLSDINNALNGLQFVPDLNYGGSATVRITTDDQGNTGAGAALIDTKSINVDVSGNAAPTIATSVISVTYVEQSGAMVVDANLTVADPDNVTLSYAVVHIAGNYASGQDVLGFVDQLGIAGSWDAATGALTLTGTATAADYEAALRTVTYRNASDDPSASARTITFVVNDGVADSAIAIRTLVPAPVNDAPIIAVPGAQAVDEDGVLVFATGNANTIVVSDSDAAATPVSLSLMATNGTLRLAQTNGISFAGGADGSSAMSLIGTVADLNAALNGMTFQPASDFNGTASVQIAVDDLGNSGSGGALSATATVSINVAPVNDAPAGADRIVWTLEDASYVFAVADFSFADSDSPSDTLLGVRLTTLPSDGVLTLAGTNISAGQIVAIADIAAGKLTFAPAKDADGLGYGRFTFQVVDDGGTVRGGVDMDVTACTMTIDVKTVNDAPVGADNTIAAFENAAYTFTLADFAFNDPNDAASNALLNVRIGALPTAGSLALCGVNVLAGDLVSAADIAAGMLVFTAAPDANGAGYASFTVQLQDDGGTAFGGSDFETGLHTLSIDVIAVNSAPQGADSAVVTSQNAPYMFAASDLGFADAADTPADTLLAIKIGSLPLQGSLTVNGVAVVAGQVIALADINNGGLVFTPTANTSGHGYASFSFRVQDSGGSANGGADWDMMGRTIAIDVMPVAVVATGDAYAPPKDVIPLPVAAQTVVVPAAPSFSSPAIAGLQIETEPSTQSEESAPAAIDFAAHDEAAAVAGDVSPIGEPVNPGNRVVVAYPSLRAAPSHGDLRGPSTARVPQLMLPGEQAISTSSFQADGNYTDVAGLAAYKESLSSQRWSDELNRMRDAAQDSIHFDNAVVASAISAVGGISVGYVVWVLRGGLLITSMLSSLPAWHVVDPAPVLANSDRVAKEEESDDPLEKLFSKAKAAVGMATGSTAKDAELALQAA